MIRSTRSENYYYHEMGIMFESIRLEESMNRVQHNQTMVWDDDDDGVNRTKE